MMEQDFIEQVRKTAREAELRGELPKQVWGQVLTSNYLNLYLPADLNGMGLEFPEAVELLEELAWIDGSLGWTVTLCSGAHWMLGFLDKTQRADLLIPDQLCITGSGFAGGEAVPLDGGYWLSGAWPHASGAIFANYFTANFRLNGKLCAMLLHAAEVQLEANWSTMGMKATASHGFRVRPQWIPARRSFIIDPSFATHPDPVFQFPFELLAAYTLVFSITGMVKRFLELAEHRQFVSAESFDRLRTALLQDCKQQWMQVKQNRQPDLLAIDATSKKARSLTEAGILLVQEVYSYQSLSAAKETTELNRVWRNLQTASLHPLLRKVP
jgi:hypothetical protein